MTATTSLTVELFTELQLYSEWDPSEDATCLDRSLALVHKDPLNNQFYNPGFKEMGILLPSLYFPF